jgi:hypothetical protein
MIDTKKQQICSPSCHQELFTVGIKGCIVLSTKRWKAQMVYFFMSLHAMMDGEVTDIFCIRADFKIFWNKTICLMDILF